MVSDNKDLKLLFLEVVVLGDDVDQEAIAGSKVNGFKVLHKFEGSDTKGGRHGIYGYLEQTATTNSGSSDRITLECRVR